MESFQEGERKLGSWAKIALPGVPSVGAIGIPVAIASPEALFANGVMFPKPIFERKRGNGAEPRLPGLRRKEKIRGQRQIAVGERIPLLLWGETEQRE